MQQKLNEYWVNSEHDLSQFWAFEMLIECRCMGLIYELTMGKNERLFVFGYECF